MKRIARLGVLVFTLSGCASHVVRLPASEGPPGLDLDYYPTDYSDSVERFKQKVASLQPTLKGSVAETYPIPNAGDDDLEIDSFFIPSKSGSGDLLIMTSGVHGAEAFAGSAIQQMFIDEILPTVDLSKTGVLFIHSVNPYGFKHFRRVNEHNVDLNRNFSADDSLYHLDNAGYSALADLLEPKEKVSSAFCERLGTDLDLVTGLVMQKYTVKELTDAIGQGQHQFPGGLEFGGTAAEPETVIVKQVVQKYSGPYQRLMFIDLHTGLGSGYQLHMMTNDGVKYSNDPLLRQVLNPQVDGNNYDLATGDDDGYYPTPGDIINTVSKLIGKDKQYLALTAEFGTVGTGTLNEMKTLSRLILENQGIHYGYTDSDVETTVENDFHELFYPSDPKWKAQVINKARYVLSRILDRLGDLKTTR